MAVDIHERKVPSTVFKRMLKGEQLFFVTPYKHDIDLDDFIVLVEIDGPDSPEGLNLTFLDEFTGTWRAARVSSIAVGGLIEGIEEGYCVLGIDFELRENAISHLHRLCQVPETLKPLFNSQQNGN